MKIAVIGGFGYKHVNGQTIKAENLCELLSDQEVIKIDSSNWKKHPFALIKNIKNAFKTCESIIMLPAHRGVKVFSRILVHFKKKYSKKIYYDVIGGWLPDYLSKDKKLIKVLSHFDGIWVETDTMKQKLDKLNVKNVTIIPNYKNINPINVSQLLYYKDEDVKKICTFSRVSKMKGISDVINAVEQVNKLGYKLELDIYGPIEDDYSNEFKFLVESSDNCHYCGIIDSNKSVDIIRNYYMLCFPTRYYTEGVPGTIIDAYCAGVPVLASKWESACDIIIDNTTGFLYDFCSNDELVNKLLFCMKNTEIVNSKKISVLTIAKQYTLDSCKEKVMRCLYGN